MQLYTVYYISVNCSLYMFLEVTPLIIRSTYNCNYSIWHRSNVSVTFRCHGAVGTNCYMTAEGSRDGLISARCCNYSYMSYMCPWSIQPNFPMVSHRTLLYIKLHRLVHLVSSNQNFVCKAYCPICANWPQTDMFSAGKLKSL